VAEHPAGTPLCRLGVALAIAFLNVSPSAAGVLTAGVFSAPTIQNLVEYIQVEFDPEPSRGVASLAAVSTVWIAGLRRSRRFSTPVG